MGQNEGRIGRPKVVKNFGVHPRRVRENPIIDECEDELVDSGLLEPRGWVDDIPLLRHLMRMMPSYLTDDRLRENATILIVLLAMVISFIIIWPLLRDLGGALGGILGGEPLVPEIIG
jgi:hypothetical protein